MAHILFMALLENERLKRELRANRRFLRWRSEPLNLPDEDFRRNFRLTKVQFFNLCEELKPLLPTARRSSAVQAQLKILAAVTFYGNGSYQKNIGAYYHLGLSQPMVSISIQEVTEALNHPAIFKKYIKFPSTPSEREENCKRFMELFGFPGVLGAIDGTHVAIIKPTEEEEAYLNRKLYHSLNVLAICDANLKIIYINAAFAGASHDSHLWNMCDIKAYLTRLQRAGEIYWLLGDSGYGQSNIMMTPILNAAAGSPEENYTKMHVQARNVVERCFGVLKGRWRCLLSHRTLHYSPVKAGKIVNACAVLHNMCREDAIAFAAEGTDSSRRRVGSTPVTPEETAQREALVHRLWTSRHQH